MAADRGAFIDQSQSLNIHIAEATYSKLTSMHFHGWKKGLKTGMYYLRTRPAADAIQFTVDQAMLTKQSQEEEEERFTKSHKSNTTDSTNFGIPTRGGVTIGGLVGLNGKGESQELITLKKSRSNGEMSLAPSPKKMKKSVSSENFGDVEITLVDEDQLKKEVEADRENKLREEEEAKLLCSIENKDACM
ncbi:hypothetical protein HK096_009556, partial [Nowakowskiella sp. JEL0078]